MILEYILDGLTTAEKIALSRFLHRAIEIIDNRYLLKRYY